MPVWPYAVILAVIGGAFLMAPAYENRYFGIAMRVFGLVLCIGSQHYLMTILR